MKKTSTIRENVHYSSKYNVKINKPDTLRKYMFDDYSSHYMNKYGNRYTQFIKPEVKLETDFGLVRSCEHGVGKGLQKYLWLLSHSVMSDSLWPHGWEPARLLCSQNFPGKNTGAGCHFLLQDIFLTQRWNPCLLCLLH